MTKILVTGITGHSGQYFLDELIAAFPEDVSIRALVRKNSDRTKIEKLIEMGRPVELFEGDLTDPASLEEMTRGMDMVFHIAGIGSSLGLVRAAIPNGVKNFVLVHTTGIYSKYKAAGEWYRQIEAEIRRLIAEENSKVDTDPCADVSNDGVVTDSPIEKAANKNVIKDNSDAKSSNTPIDLTILRPTMIYGSLDDQNMVKFIKMTDKLRLFPMVKGGRFALQPVHQQDLGRAYLQVINMLLDKTFVGGTQNFGNGEDFSINKDERTIENNEKIEIGETNRADGPKTATGAQSKEPANIGTTQILRPATAQDREYILSGGTVIDLIDIMRLISEYLGKKTTFFSFPFGLAYIGAWGVFLISLGKVDFREKVQRLVEPRNYPHDVATRDFGYNPMPFAEGLKREVNLYKNR